jgi:hypothetical protein
MFDYQVWRCAMILSLDLFIKIPHVLNISMLEIRFHLLVDKLLTLIPCEPYEDDNFVTKVVNQIKIGVRLVMRHKKVVR